MTRTYDACVSRVRSASNLLQAFAVVLWLAGPATATVYQVGPGRPYTNLQAVANIVNPGDTIEVDGGHVYEPVTFRRAGTATQPVTVRGIRANGKRPIISGSDPASGYTVYFRSDWAFQNENYIFEGFEVTGGTEAAIRIYARNIVIRDVVVRDCPRHGILSHDWMSGNLTLEYVEVYNVGGTHPGENVKHPIYVTTSQQDNPGSVFRMRYCYIHDNRSGNNLKSRAERNEIYYNWFEGAEYYELELIGPDDSGAGRRADSDVVGNVIVSTRATWSVRLGSDGHNSSNGRYRFVNNTFVNLNPAANSTGGFLRENYGIESLELINNIFYYVHPAYGWGPYVNRSDGGVWTTGKPVVTMVNNWVKTGTVMPGDDERSSGTHTGTIYGSDPGFLNGTPAAFDPRLKDDAPVRDRATAQTTASNAYGIPNPLLTAADLPPIRRSALFTTLKPTQRPQGSIDIGAIEGSLGLEGDVPSQPIPRTSLRINAGGEAFVGDDGEQWVTDAHYLEGNVYAVPDRVEATSNGALYQSERWSPSSLRYRIPVGNGTYSVKLKFAEIYYGDAGQRVFQILLNGQVAESRFDPFQAAGGAFRAVDRTYAVTATNGVIEIELTRVAGEPKISGIEILPN